MISKLLQFIKYDIWRISLKDYSPRKSFFIKQLRIITLAIRGFREDLVQLRASALTFYSLLSVVPVVAMAFGMAKGFGFESRLEKQLLENFEGQQEVIKMIIEFANSLLETTKGGLIAGIGLVVLFWSAMKVLGNIESSFNVIWQIKKSRIFVRKFSDYLSIMLIAPVLMIMSSSVTVYITTQLTNITEKVALIGYISPFIFFLIKLIPYALIWLLFTFLYIIMPNTKVNFRSGFIAGIMAGTTFQVVQWLYIHFQVGVSKYNAIYGSFAALPLFLIWLQISWLIVLFGGEISFSHQNVEKYEFETDTVNISFYFKKILSLLVANLVVKIFSRGEKPLTASEISKTLKIPIRLVREIIYEFVDANIFSETISGIPREHAYQPAQDINRLSIQYILEALEKRGSTKIAVAKTSEVKSITEAMNSFKEILSESPENKLIKDI